MNTDDLRRRVGGSVRRLVVGTDDARPIELPDPDAPTLVPADSPVRVVHADPAMFVGGVRSLLFQTLHPVAMYAVSEHSDYRDDPLGRLHRTARFLGATTFGTVDDAHLAISQVRAIHARVVGEMPDGTIYRADDPRLLGWVHATEVDSFLTAHQRYGAEPLTGAECDAYVADMAPVAELLGADDAPTSQAELSAMIDSFRGELAPTNECRDATRFLFAPQLPITVLPFYGLIFSSAVALLPRWARSMLLLPVAPGIDPLVLRPATVGLTRALRWAMTPDQPSHSDGAEAAADPRPDQGGSST